MKRFTKRIYTVHGPRGSGKSTTVARFLRPSELHKAIIIDTEDSMSNIVENNRRLGKEFGAYIRMYERLTKGQREDVLDAIARGEPPWVTPNVKQSALVEYYEYFIRTLNETLKDNLSDGKPKYIFLGIDTIEPIEAGLTAWIETHKRQAGWSGRFDFGKRETEGVRPLYENTFEGCYQKGVSHFCVASHLKPVWEKIGPREVRRVPNKVQVGGRIVVLSRLSSQMWWLVPNVGNADGAPAAIRLKARYAFEDIDRDADEWITQTMLPQRIPHFTWRDVRWYQEHGCDLANPPDNERITKGEREMISEFLTEEQMRLMVLGAEMNLEAMKQESTPILAAPGATFTPPLAPQAQDSDPILAPMVKRAEELSLNGTRESIRETMMNAYPLPLRGRIDEAIEKALG